MHQHSDAVSSDEDDVDIAEGDGAPAKGMSKTLALRMQKKLMGMTVKSKEAAKNFIDDDMGGSAFPSLVTQRVANHALPYLPAPER